MGGGERGGGPVEAAGRGEQPGDEGALCAALAEAAARREAVLVHGAGTKRHLGPAPSRPTRAIGLGRLAGVVEYEPGDLVITARAGTRLEDLQRILAAERQWLPLDPPYAGATLGGILATGGSGPRRLAYGPARDHVLGMRVAGPGGAVTKCGGRVVKNVTGFDLHKLHVGAFGTLGIILEVSLKVRPRPEVSGLLALGGLEVGAAHRRLLALASARVEPAALELLDADAAAPLRAAVPGLPPDGALALVGVEGTQPFFTRQARLLEPLRAEAPASAWLEGETAELLWQGLRDLPAAHAGDVVLRLGARPHDLPDALALAAKVETRAVSIHVGLGTAHVALHPRELASPRFAALGAELRETLGARGGYAVAESAPPRLEGREELPWFTARHGLDPRVKRAFDPDNLLNPGRMTP